MKFLVRKKSSLRFFASTFVLLAVQRRALIKNSREGNRKKMQNISNHQHLKFCFPDNFVCDCGRSGSPACSILRVRVQNASKSSSLRAGLQCRAQSTLSGFISPITSAIFGGTELPGTAAALPRRQVLWWIRIVLRSRPVLPRAPAIFKEATGFLSTSRDFTALRKSAGN